MGNYASSTYTKPDPDCEKCDGRGVTVEKFWESGRRFLESTIKVRCHCTDIKRPAKEGSV